MFCPNCGLKIIRRLEFCPNCSCPLTAKAQEKMAKKTEIHIDPEININPQFNFNPEINLGGSRSGGKKSRHTMKWSNGTGTGGSAPAGGAGGWSGAGTGGASGTWGGAEADRYAGSAPAVTRGAPAGAYAGTAAQSYAGAAAQGAAAGAKGLMRSGLLKVLLKVVLPVLLIVGGYIGYAAISGSDPIGLAGKLGVGLTGKYQVTAIVSREGGRLNIEEFQSSSMLGDALQAMRGIELELKSGGKCILAGIEMNWTRSGDKILLTKEGAEGEVKLEIHGRELWGETGGTSIYGSQEDFMYMVFTRK